MARPAARGSRMATAAAGSPPSATDATGAWSIRRAHLARDHLKLAGCRARAADVPAHAASAMATGDAPTSRLPQPLTSRLSSFAAFAAGVLFPQAKIVTVRPQGTLRFVGVLVAVEAQELPCPRRVSKFTGGANAPG